MNLAIDDLMHRDALRDGFGLPQERLARMAAARALAGMQRGFFASGELAAFAAVDAFDRSDARLAIESPFVIGENITV